MNIVEEVKKLGLPLDKVLVFSSGTLQVLGIRDAKDIDLAVTKDVYDQLFLDPSWEHVILPWGSCNLRKGGVEIIPKLEWDQFPVTVDDALKRSLRVDEVNFMSLEDVKGFKKAMGREKDYKDIELIDQYLKRKSEIAFENKLR